MTTAGCSRRFLVGLASVGLAAAAVLAPTAAGAAGTAKPSLSVTPSTNLVDLQTVHVAGANFPAGADIATIQCIKGSTGEAGCDLSTLDYTPANSSGAFALDRSVRRILSTASDSHYDCAKAPGACTLAAADISNTAVHASVFLSFNPKVPPKKTTVTVTPSTKLVDHQLVTVIGGGVAPGSFVSVAQCAPGPPSVTTCDTSTYSGVEAGAAGGFYVRWPVHRILLLGGFGSQTTVDCAKVKCQVIAGNTGGTGPVPAAAPLSFNPGVPPVRQSLFVFPHDNLVDKQLVTVSGNGFTPGIQVTMVECASGATSQSSCDISSLPTALAGFVGHFTTKVALHRFITTSTGQLDCASAPGACTLTAVNVGRYTIEGAMASLSFNPKAPPPTVTVAVSPNTGLHDDQAVTVRGTGLTPLGEVQVSECTSVAVNGVTAPFCTGTTMTVADPHGHISTTYFVHTVVNGPHGLISCQAKPGTCSIGLNEGYNIVPEAEAPLSFA